MPSNEAAAWLTENEDAGIERLMEWLRIPSISTDPAYRSECRSAAEWAADHLRGSGFEADLINTGSADKPGHPIVLATAGPADGAPHVLFYGHYDVQPPDPLELWDSPPFEPVRREAQGGVGERVVARGAVDDKGQVATFLEAMRALWETTGTAAGGARYTVVLEGEEESGSTNLEDFLRRHESSLGKCDICLISDTGMLGRGKPAITCGIRGIQYCEVRLHAADQDLHSGQWGGKVPNPLNELAKVLSGLWDSDQRVTIPGFYEGVPELSAEERSAWQSLGIDPAKSLKGIGLEPEADVGERGYSFIEREWARPTCDINGIYGGYTGEGAKTVIPAHATAKVSFRLVGDQDPAKVRDAFFAWLEERRPPGCRWELKDLHGGPPALVSMDSPYLAMASAALKVAGGDDAAMIRTGGSIPVAGLLKKILGLETIFMGFGLEDDRVHSPNEKFEIDCFRLGARAHVEFAASVADRAG